MTGERVEYRAGWVDDEGRWTALTGAATCATREAAQAELDKLVDYYGEAHGVNLAAPSKVGRAIRAGRVEVRRRTTTVSEWE
jgi:hypothetical protein